mmetsp:Transcript_16415/g.38937  ORF Transcript_16415/g.38937 Transcript_16415/m.38937 type:complete len:903 (-) Transcript_16415:167-2875(-)
MAHHLLAAFLYLGSLASSELLVDRTSPASTFDGIGGLSGGGATSVLLPDYSEPSRSQILDYLFKPSFGASLQILKVEIGGDSQSTDGTESSHMHTSESVDLHTGYEWWLMQEAKKRNPEIKLYGLAWAFPGWVGEGTGDPFKFPEQTARYLAQWVSGAKSEYGLDIDYLGIWNERASDSNFVQVLRKTLDQGGWTGTKLVVKDGGLDICDKLLKDKPYADAVDIVGLHYPSDFADFSACHKLGKPIWASEESSSYDDANGAACWGRVMNSHWVINQMTSSIMWNLVGAYYHGTNWYASSMMTSVEPWSGHYEVNPVIWATAHITQFTHIGWRYLATGAGSGILPRGGYYTTWVDPESDDFTMNFVKISRDHASCTRPTLPEFDVEEESITVTLAASMKAPEQLQVWYSNFEKYDSSEAPVFQHSTVFVRGNKFSLQIPVGSMFTVTTIKSGSKGGFPSIPPSSPSFPLDYADDFQGTPPSSNARWFADQIGSFEIHNAGDGKKSLKQMVSQLPIGWQDKGSRGPMTLIGMREWQDIKVKVAFKLPSYGAESPQACAADFPIDLTDHQCLGLLPSTPTSPDECRDRCCATRCSVWQWDEASSSCWIGNYSADPGACKPATGFKSRARQLRSSNSACIAVRVDQMWANGVVFCVDRTGHWHLANSGPPLEGTLKPAPVPIASGMVPALEDGWHTLSLEVGANNQATALLDSAEMISGLTVRDLDTGFAALGASGWFPIEFRNFTISKAPGWDPPVECQVPTPGAQLSVRKCSRNGLVVQDQAWNLLPSFQLQHQGSGLCASASTSESVILETCDSTKPSQIFSHDYTLIRNELVELTASALHQPLAGKKSGATFVGRGGDWTKWSYFPNSKQLRNQYVAVVELGYPMCLSACPQAQRPQRFLFQ